MVSHLPPPSQAAKALRVKAVRLEREGDLEGAFAAYEQAVALAPEDPELLTSLAELAGQLEMHDLAVRLWAHLSLAQPGDVRAALGHARALVAAARFSEAMDLLQSVLQAHPEEPRLWTTLGLALTYAGRAEEALTFFDEGVRLGPRLPGARYNRGLAWCDLGRMDEAEADFTEAARLAKPGTERATIEFSRATAALARGDLAEGWALYERRLSPDAPRPVIFQAPGRRLAKGEKLAGRSVLVLGEQGIGDEVMFAGAIPDLIEEVGPDGRVALAVEPRLVDLFRRSFPEAEVGPHATQRAGARVRRSAATPPARRIDFWTPLGSLTGRYRPTAAAFPHKPYLTPDPARVAHWRAWLGEAPAVGITWRSGKTTGERRRFYPDLPLWTDLLRTPGVQIVNVQYGDCADELVQLRELAGVEIREPPGLDIKEDIDDLAALCAALSAVVAVQNATGALAGAVGAPVYFVAGPGSWTQLGEPAATPWYADAHVCTTGSFGDWRPALAAATAAVRTRLAA